MRKEEISQALHREMARVRVSPALLQRTAAAARGKERVYMKKKLVPALVCALMAVLLCAAAFAAAGRWGMLDFADRYAAAHYIPEDAQDYIKTDVAVMENEWVRMTVRELYYDGRTSRITVDVTPKESHTLLVGEDTFMEDPFINLTHEYVMDGENDMRSVYQVIEDEGYERVYAANVYMKGAVDDVFMGSMDYILGEDGTLTIYSQEEYKTDLPEREVTISAVVMPFDQPLTMDSRANWEEGKVLETPVMLRASVNPTDAPAGEGEIANVYVNEAPAEFQSVGVRVDRLLIEVKPQEIYATVEYTVVDREKFDALGGGLWFEFIDPQIESDVYAEQRLMSGLFAGGASGPVDGDLETATTFRQSETLGKNELRDAYTLRVFDCWGKERYETQTLAMRPATQEDLE